MDSGRVLDVLGHPVIQPLPGPPGLVRNGYLLCKRCEVVVDPARGGGEVELVDVVVGADEVDVLAVIAERVAVQGGGGDGWHGAGQGGQVVVDPARAGVGQLVDVAVDADEDDVLAVVAEPEAVEGAGGGG